MKKDNSKLAEKLTTFLFYLSTLLFFIAFNFQDSKTSGWYQQFLPNLNGRAISDITFVDSLIGFAVTPNAIINDTGYILKTTNGGNNWSTNSIYPQYHGFYRVVFVNQSTGFVAGSALLKTTNSGLNWTTIPTPNNVPCSDISIINLDTFYFCMDVAFDGGLFITTNGGLNWTRLYYSASSNPSRVYMFNKNIGFIMANNNQILKTTNGGNNWFEVLTGEGYSDIHFTDSLTGWKAGGYIKKTTNGGLNWLVQPLPYSNWLAAMGKISVINKDTIWGVGGAIQWIPSTNHFRGIVYKTTNGGANWGYQIPDTSVDSYYFQNINFINNKNGWAYYAYNFHTNIGGNDTTYYTKIKEQVSNIVSDFILYQNYPNPFNSMTNVKFQMLKRGFAEIKVFDITGKMIKTLINQKQNTGTYDVKFDAENLSSGIYFYSLFVDGVRVDTKKTVLIK